MKPWMRWTLWVTLVLGVVFGVLRYFFIDFHTVPEDRADMRNWSMAPALEPGDKVLVWRVGEPHLGDVVRCADPADPSRWFVGRVIGLPGDKLEMRDGIFVINGFRVKTGACKSKPRKIVEPDGSEADVPCVEEEVASSHHEILLRNQQLMNETVVEQGKLFLMSDARTAPWAYDSRTPEIGQFPEASCHQRLVVRLFSKQGWGDSERRFTFLF